MSVLNTANKILLGTNTVGRIYLGTNLVFEGKTLLERVQAIFQVPGTDGFFWDPSALGKINQSAYGHRDDGAVSSPIGAMLNNLPDSTLGPNIAAGGGTFTGSAAGWSFNSYWEYLSGKLWFKAGQPADYARSQETALESGAFYVVEFDTNSVDNQNYVGVYGGPYNSQFNNIPGGHARGYIFGANTTYMSFRGVSATLATSVDNVTIRKMVGHPAMQNNAGKRPTLRQTGAVYWVDHAVSGTEMFTTFKAALGSSCTIARSVPSVGTTVLTGQAVGAGTWTNNTNHSGLLLVNRALTTAETNDVTALFNARAGI